MNRKIHLLGNLSQFGEVWEMEAKSIGDVIQLIDCQEQGFRKFLIDAAESGLDMAIVGKDFRVEDPDELLFQNLGPEEVYISLVPAGSKKGWGKILLAAVLITVGLLIPGGATFIFGSAKATAAFGTALISAGISIGLQGITQLLAKTPDADDQKTKEGLFDGPTSTLKQGQPVPVLYGELLIGGAPIHVDLTATQSTGPGGIYGTPFPTITVDGSGNVTVDYNNFSNSGNPWQNWSFPGISGL